jgi:hypothetical protein
VSTAGMSSGVELPPRRRSWTNHGGQAHAQAWACEAPKDHPRVAGADDARTNPQLRLRSGTPSRGTSQQALTTRTDLVTVRRLRVQLSVLLACSPCWCWRGAGRVLGARDAARTSASAQAGVDRVDELRRAATRLSRDLVAMETSRRAYLVTGDEASGGPTSGPRPGPPGACGGSAG